MTFNADELRDLLKIGQTKSYRGYCKPEEIKRLRNEGFKVENFDFGIEEIDITRLF